MKVKSAKALRAGYLATFIEGDDEIEVVVPTDTEGEKLTGIEKERFVALAKWLMPDPETGAPGNKAEPYVPTIEDLRSKASLTRGDFCRALMRAEILPPMEAALASGGQWPQSFADAIADLPEIDQAEAIITWSDAKSVSRMHPLLLSLAANRGIGDEALDQMFGIEATE